MAIPVVRPLSPSDTVHPEREQLQRSLRGADDAEGELRERRPELHPHGAPRQQRTDDVERVDGEAHRGRDGDGASVRVLSPSGIVSRSTAVTRVPARTAARTADRSSTRVIAMSVRFSVVAPRRHR